MYQVGMSDRKDMEILLKVSSKIKEIIANIDIEYFKTILTSHYRTLNLIDSSGKWMTEKLNRLSDTLIPKDIERNSLGIFIDEIAMLCTRNSYLMNFLKECSNKKFDNLKRKVDAEGKKIITDVVIYAYMIDILSKECVKNYLILEELYHCFSVNRNRMKSFKELPLIHKVELVSVENSIRRYLKCHKKNNVREDFGSIAISKNIFEVTCADIIYGEIGNAKAGFVLGLNRCGLRNKEECTGAGPSTLSKDDMVIEHAFPLAESWTNLYQVWNMCFTMKFKDFPYGIANLLIPQVANYYRNPYKYIYNMNIALYISLNFASFNYGNRKTDRENIVDWRDKELRKIFSYSNKKSAELYKEKLKRARE